LVNFGNTKYFIKAEKPILELFVFRNDKDFKPHEWKTNQYKDDRISDTLRLPKTFLDIAENEKKLARIAKEGLKTWFLIAITVLGAIATGFIVWQAIVTNSSISNSNGLIEKFEHAEKIVYRLEQIEQKINKIESQSNKSQ
jgi:hypothetical protein